MVAVVTAHVGVHVECAAASRVWADERCETDEVSERTQARYRSSLTFGSGVGVHMDAQTARSVEALGAMGASVALSAIGSFVRRGAVVTGRAQRRRATTGRGGVG